MKIEIGSEDTNGVYQLQLSVDISQLGSEEKLTILRQVQTILSALHGMPSLSLFSNPEVWEPMMSLGGNEWIPHYDPEGRLIGYHT